MTYTQLEEIGNLNLRNLLNFPNLDMPIYYPIILFTIFIVFTLGTFFREIRREGRGNILSSLAIGGFVTTAISFILSLLNLIQKEVVIITMVISLIFGVLFLLTKKR